MPCQSRVLIQSLGRHFAHPTGLEHRIQDTLKTHHETFPNQTSQLVSNPTARWIFPLFAGIPVLIIGATPELVWNLNEHQAAWLKLLGGWYEALYSGSG